MQQTNFVSITIYDLNTSRKTLVRVYTVNGTANIVENFFFYLFVHRPVESCIRSFRITAAAYDRRVSWEITNISCRPATTAPCACGTFPEKRLSGTCVNVAYDYQAEACENRITARRADKSA